MKSKNTLTVAQQKDLRDLWQYSQRLGVSHPGYLSVTTLATEFGVAPATIRRYLVARAPEASLSRRTSDRALQATRRNTAQAAPKPDPAPAVEPAPVAPASEPTAPIDATAPNQDAPPEPPRPAFSITQVPLEDDQLDGPRKRKRFYVTAPD